jgi:prepilin-type N-terminal cleavage/methylation domain-containing protein
MLARQHKTQMLRPAQSGFTLIELLIVMTIIGILAALILPAINSARTTARIAEVKSEMESIKASITQFKVRFGIEPPSHLTFCEQGSDWSDPTVIAANPRIPESRGIIRQLWPSYPFGDLDLNNSGTTTDIHEFNGAECLVFFLGGLVDSNSGAFIGFSKNPAAPFALGGDREGPFFEFDPPRTISLDGDVFLEYLDKIPSQSKPILYFSTYGRQRYPTTVSGTTWYNSDNWDPINSIGMQRAYYRTVDAADAGKSTPYEKSSYQLISPGFDYEYGVGGAFDVEQSSLLSEADKDNITSFHSGQLGR